MKLRFRENTLRLRVNRREVATLAAGQVLREQINFPGDSRLTYLLESREQGYALASFDGGTIRVAAPFAEIQSWADSESIGLYFDIPTTDRNLKVAIEKDLECVDGPAEERDPEAYPRHDGSPACP
jgi:hypothetical protein